MLPLALALALSASPALDEARGHLKAGRIDDVYFALEKASVGADEKGPAAEVLAEASKKALAKKDAVMALQLAQMGVKLAPTSAPALEAAARASRALEQFEDAERYADAWVAADDAKEEARLLRAELAVDNADWDVALTHLDAVKWKGPSAGRAKALREKASRESGQKSAGMSALKDMQRQMEKARAERARAGAEAPSADPVLARSSEVIVYSTAWCGYCRKAKAWLSKKGVAFTEKNIEKDPGAAAELAQKAAAQGVMPSGVPVIDVRGTLVLGFDERRLEELL